MTPPAVARVIRIKFAIAGVFDQFEATESEAASALASFLLDVFCEARKERDAQVAGEMQRIADQLTLLALTPAAEMETLALALADTVRAS